MTPSGELRTNTLLWPLASSWFQITCTPLWSAVTWAKLENDGNVKPLGHANGPSPHCNVSVGVSAN